MKTRWTSATSLRLAALVAVLLGGAPWADAQTPADRAAAEQLFRQGRDLMKQGSVAEACAKFDASNRLDPAYGTLLNLGDCYEKLARPVSAWLAFNDAADRARKAGQQDRVKNATKRAAAMEPRLSRLKITIAPDADVAGLALTRDDQPVDRALLGVAAPLDPGTYTITATAPGRVPSQAQVTLVEGQTATVEVAPLQPVAKPVVTPVALPPAQPTAPDTLDAVPGQSRGHGRRVLALTVGLAGVAALGVGSYFGFTALSKWGDAQDQCGGPQLPACTAQARATESDANSAANLANIFVGGGLALVATGVILYLTAPRDSDTAARQTGWHIVPGSGSALMGLSVRSRF